MHSSKLAGYRQSMMMSCTFIVDRQVARYFLISVSDPGRSFRERCVRCLKAFVSTILRFEGPWSNADEADVSCNRNLTKKQFLQPIHIKKRFMRDNIQIISHRGFSLSCSEMHCSSKSMNFCGNDVKSIKSPCCTFKLRRKANNDYYTENLTLSQILLC